MKCIYLITLLASFARYGYSQINETKFINKEGVSASRFGNDRGWYMDNIPFFECSDNDIESVYYYRWELYKAHIRNIGKEGYVITEFLNPMSWDRKPYNSLNDATAFHIYEGRWLKDKHYINGYIEYLYHHGGNDRHFSESIADAAYAAYLVNPDTAFTMRQLKPMISIYNQWFDQYDFAKGLYYIEPLLDATEYTISSIDASGGKDGFRGGDSFRPSINSYMYANAIAIKNIALLKGDTRTASEFSTRAGQIKSNVLKSLWNPTLHHFTDRYKENNRYVKYWDFIRGRELVGFVPWTFDLPDDNPVYASAWKHLTDTAKFSGKYGLRTNEPSYEYYMKQYRYTEGTGERECQWNGPGWPFQTSQVLLGMANLLNNYSKHSVSKDDYLNVLKQYALQHKMGTAFNLAEDYDPDKGGPIVNLNQRSEHYNHSEYNDLVITGLCGLRPASGNDLTIYPLITQKAIKYFCLENVLYHGHLVTILYDESGKKYSQGRGLSVFVNGKRIAGPTFPEKLTVHLPDPVIQKAETKINLALNVSGTGFPKAFASHTDTDGSGRHSHAYNTPADKTYMAIDGRIWYFQDVLNRWSCRGSKEKQDWFEVDFDSLKMVNNVSLYFYGDQENLTAPLDYHVKYWDGASWAEVTRFNKQPLTPLANTQNILTFSPFKAEKVRIYFTNAGKGKYTALTELEIY